MVTHETIFVTEIVKDEMYFTKMQLDPPVSGSYIQRSKLYNGLLSKERM